MIADLLWALPIGLLGGWLLLRAARQAGEGDARLGPCLPALALIALLVLAAELTVAFGGYISDIWTYLTVVERVAQGQMLLDREPFWLESPAGPHHSINWLLLGVVRGWTGADPIVLARALGIGSMVLLTLAAWLLARRALGGDSAPVATALFWAMQPQQWSQLALNRNGALAYFFLALFFAFAPRPGRGDLMGLAVSLALAFYTHLFAGLLTLTAVGIALAARHLGEGRPATLQLGGAVALALMLAAPCLVYGFSTVGLDKSEALLGGPGQVRWLGLRWFSPMQLLRELSPPLLLLAAMGLAMRDAFGRLTPLARHYCLSATLAALLFFFTPLYHLWSERLGGWLAVRVAALPLLWLPASGALLVLAGPKSGRQKKLLALAFSVALFWLGGARLVRDLRHGEIYLPYSASARTEARLLRPILSDEIFLSAGYLSLGLAPYVLGRPLWVPPGYASPIHPFEERAGLASAVLTENSPDCWALLLAKVPDLAFLITPAPGATDEELAWRRQLPTRSPQMVRQQLGQLGVLEPLSEGTHFILDRIRPSGPVGEPGRCRTNPP